MHDFFEIKPSPGKGNGVFATKAISPGSTILRDVPVMQINRQQSETAEQDVQQAFNRLSKANQRKLLDLHAAEANGANAGKSKLYRIHKDNAFGEEESSFMVPTISRINHACALTATIAAAPGESAGLGVVAEKPIAAGEEVSISYKEGLLQTLTSWQRKALLRGSYGFRCSCRLCCLDSRQLLITDMRRCLICGLWYGL